MVALPFKGRFLPAIGQGIEDFGYGLAKGGFDDAFGIAAEHGAQMQPYRDAESLRRKTEAEKAAARNETVEWLKRKAATDPRYADLVAAAQIPGADLGQIWKDGLALGAPKPADPFTLEPGQTRYSGDGTVIASGGEVPVDPKEAFDMETGLSNQYVNTPEFKTYDGVRRGYENVQKAAALGTGAGDMSLIFGYMKMLDPASTVREGEYANAQNTGGIPAFVWNTYNKIKDGQFLTPKQRAEFMRAAEGLYADAAKNLEAVNQQFTTRADSYGVDEGRFLRVPEVYAKPGGGITGKTSTGITFDFTPDM